MDETSKLIKSDVAQEIERQVELDGTESKQPRFKDSDNKRNFLNLYAGDYLISEQVPPYKADSRKRDTWLLQFAKQEPYLISTMQQAVSIDSNRGWFMVGGETQVSKYSEIVKYNYALSPGQYGYRMGIAASSRSFYNTDINAIVEIWRQGEAGPMVGLAHVDPTLCFLTSNPEAPLKYIPGGKAQEWKPRDFFRVTSMPDVQEKFNGLGYCAVSRCLSLALTIYAVQRHDQEQLGARSPKGLLLLQGISEKQWNLAMDAREDGLSQMEREYYGGVAVLATSNLGDIDAKLVALSQLPKGFDSAIATDMLMYGYALAFGYDPSEFWPVKFGSLGRGQETQIQHDKATQKGGISFPLGFQEQLQEELPDSIHYEFEERDDRGDLVFAEVQQTRADVINTLAGIRETTEPVLNQDQLLQLLAQAGLIPPEWSEAEEEIKVDDEGAARSSEYKERMLEKPEVIRAIEKYPDEPIVRYTWRPAGDSIVTIWGKGSEALRHYTRGVDLSYLKSRQDETDPESIILYESEDGEVVITQADVDRAVAVGCERDEELCEVLNAEVIE